MSSHEIIKLLSILIGNTEATGDSRVDEVVKQNLTKLVEVTGWCLSLVVKSSATRNNTEWSMHDIGENAIRALRYWEDWMREEISINEADQP